MYTFHSTPAPYQGKSDPQECGKCLGISLLSVVGILYANVLIGRVVESTDTGLGEEWSGFRKDESGSDPTFFVTSMCDKIEEKTIVA